MIDKYLLFDSFIVLNGFIILENIIAFLSPNNAILLL